MSGPAIIKPTAPPDPREALRAKMKAAKEAKRLKSAPAPSPLKAAILAHFAGGFIPFYEKHLQNMKPAGKEFMALCPFHADKNSSLSVNPETGLWKCFAGCGGGNIFAFYGKLHGLDPANGGFPAILAGIGQDFGISADTPKVTTKPRIVKEYTYTDEAGKILFQVVRLEPKSFRQRRLDGKSKWVWNMQGVEPVLYHLPEVARAFLIMIASRWQN